ncbi:hypothetical protein EBS_2157 [endosymbiont of unidentified scaly snail isolate Monju]|nr:hypothetical protein EBS_2157 [endosymbiont of unidentified scaly snail isolate Monju]
MVQRWSAQRAEGKIAIDLEKTMKRTKLILLCLLPLSAVAEDGRVLVELPPMMREHMLHNMRDHLETLRSIVTRLGQADYEGAAELAEGGLGMSAMQMHGAAHMAPFMPEGMRQAGIAMHRAASRFAQAARDAEVRGDPATALRALADVMAQCTACHAGYRLQ